MNVEELKESTEHARHKGEKQIGLTMAIVAVLLATATLMGHRAHTEEILLQGKINDQWGFYQAKHGRAHDYGSKAEIAALLPNGKALALRALKVSLDEECGVPAEKNCSSPVLKDSPILQQLVAENGGQIKSAATASKAGPAKPEEAHAENAAAPDASETKEEKPHKQSGGKDGAVKIQEGAREMETEKLLAERRANFYDSAELFLEISIVLCSIALLADMKLFWGLSFITTIAGVAVALWGLILHG